ncbi:alpha/beta fold hydrolase [Streptomyces sp. DW26H14]|uniref:alpha/beta fold hydrolase n=1 Tax=Streptomyces sp. DW26H14 TaxID=3435395 RepID=UPI00403DA662
MTARIERTAAGDIEVEERGSGTPVLVMHGSPGGIDAARVMGEFLPEDRFRSIALSRPGYLGTPLGADDSSIDHEADLLAALLDRLGVEQAGVLAWSGGGPAAYRLAVRHPERVTSLVAVAAVSARWVAPAPSASERFLFGTRAGQRLTALLARHSPARLIEGALAGEGSVRGEELKALAAEVLADPAQRAAVLAFATTVGTTGRRRAGWQNDVVNFAAIDSLELGRVRCPVLLIHGDADTDAAIDFSHSARAALTESRLIVMHHGTHLAFYAHPNAADAQDEARTFLAANAAGTPGSTGR